MKTEYQKCMDGEFFTADSEMLQIVYRCKRLVRSLNGTDMENISERKKIIGELFGSVGNNVHIDIDLPRFFGYKVQLQKFILPFTANIIFFSNNITCIIVQINRLVAIGKLLESNPYRFFQFNFLFFLRHNYVLILLPIQI